MLKKNVDEIVTAFNSVGVGCSRAPRPGHRRSWAVSFVLDVDKRDAFEDILVMHSDIKLKVEYEPMGINIERVYLY